MSTPLSRQIDQMAEAQELREEVERLREQGHAYRAANSALEADLRKERAEIERLRAENKAQGDVILALEALLSAYRLGRQSRADAALTKLEKARAALAAAQPEEEKT